MPSLCVRRSWEAASPTVHQLPWGLQTPPDEPQCVDAHFPALPPPALAAVVHVSPHLAGYS